MWVVTRNVMWYLTWWDVTENGTTLWVARRNVIIRWVVMWNVMWYLTWWVATRKMMWYLTWWVATWNVFWYLTWWVVTRNVMWYFVNTDIRTATCWRQVHIVLLSRWKFHCNALNCLATLVFLTCCVLPWHLRLHQYSDTPGKFLSLIVSSIVSSETSC